MIAQTGSCSFFVVEILCVLVISIFKSPGSEPRVGFCWSIVVPGHCSLVHHTSYLASPIHWASAKSPLAIAPRNVILWLVLSQNQFVVFINGLPHVRHASVGNLYSIPIDDLCKGVVGGEAGVNELQELGPHVGCNILGEGGIKPRDIFLIS